MNWRIEPKWAGKTAFLLAGGPSLKGFDAGILRNHGKVLTINDSWRLAPWAHASYFCDWQWWQMQQAKNPRAKLSTAPGGEVGFHDMIYRAFWITSSPKFADNPQVHCIQLTGDRGLETSPVGVKHGSNSGYQAINLAYLLGAARIILLGYDMKCQAAHTHWHDEPRQAQPVFQTVLDSFIPAFDTLAAPLKEAGVEVINCTPDSALKCWPYVPLEEVLEPQLSFKEMA